MCSWLCKRMCPSTLIYIYIYICTFMYTHALEELDMPGDYMRRMRGQRKGLKGAAAGGHARLQILLSPWLPAGMLGLYGSPGVCACHSPLEWRHLRRKDGIENVVSRLRALQQSFKQDQLLSHDAIGRGDLSSLQEEKGTLVSRPSQQWFAFRCSVQAEAAFLRTRHVCLCMVIVRRGIYVCYCSVSCGV